MEQVSVAMFDIDKVSPGIGRDLGCLNIGIDERLDLSITEHLLVPINMKTPIQEGMAVSDPRFPPALFIGSAESPGMGQLKSDHQVIHGPVTFAMRLHEFLPKILEVGLGRGKDHQLIRIRSAIRSYRHGLTAIDQLRSTLSESTPATVDFLGRSARLRSIPALHRMDRPTVSNRLAIDAGLTHRLKEGGLLACFQRLVTGDRDPQSGHMLAETSNGFQRRQAY